MQLNVEPEPGRDGKSTKPIPNFSNGENVHRLIFIDRLLVNIFTLHRKFQRGEIISRTFYRKKTGWNNRQKSWLIESLLLHIPIPMIYMKEGSEGKLEVVDGQQRLDAVFDFFNCKYPLTGLTLLTHLNGKSFLDFEINNTALQRRLEEYQVSLLVIKKESSPEMGLEIFRRLNR